MRLSLLILACLFAVHGFGQSIARNERDKLTGSKIVETEWDLLTKNAGVFYHYRIRVVDNDPFLDLQMKVPYGNLWTISKGYPLILKLDNDTVVKLSALETSVSSHGSGDIGMLGYQMAQTTSSYELTTEAINAILENELVTLKIMTSEGFLDEPVLKKYKRRLLSALELLWPRGKHE